jgi:ABC-2 type transport system permease protein
VRLLGVVFVNEWRAYLRNRMAVFWVFLFPLLLYVLLGFAVGNDLGLVRVSIATADGPASQAAAARIESELRQARLFRVEMRPAGAPADLSLQVQVRPGHVTVTTEHAPSRSAALYLALRSVERSASAYALAHTAGAPEVVVAAGGRSTGPQPLRYDRFLFTGVIVLMMLSGGVLSLAYALAGQREQNVLKAHATWPLPPRLYLAGVVAARLLLLLLAALAFLGLGQWLFGLDMLFDLPRLAATCMLLVLGSALFLALGFCLAARSRNVASTELLGNAVYYPLLLLGDLTLPLRELPGGLDRLLHWMPTNQLAAGLRTALFDPAPYTWPWVLLVYLVALLLAFAVLGARSFRFVGGER